MERQIFRFVTIIIVQTASLKRLCVQCHSFTSVIRRATLLLTRLVILGEATRAYNSHRARFFFTCLRVTRRKWYFYSGPFLGFGRPGAKTILPPLLIQYSLIKNLICSVYFYIYTYIILNSYHAKKFRLLFLLIKISHIINGLRLPRCGSTFCTPARNGPVSTINRYSKLQIEQDIWYPRCLVN